MSDRILIYRKNSDTKLYKLPLSDKAKKEYSYSDKKGAYRRANLLDLTRGKFHYKVETPDGTVLNGPWMIDENRFKQLVENDGIHWPKSGKQIPYGKTYLADQIDKGQISSDFWDGSYGTNQRAAKEIKDLFGSRAFKFAKPEELLRNLISISSKPTDMVLDFFMGSGTTPAVALKMNRHFIGIDQMDYIDTIGVNRLQKVINGEQGGISKEVDWQGGGSFIYAELMEKNQGYLRDIQNAENMDELMNVYSRMKQNGDIDFRVDLNKFETSLKAGELPSIEDRKKELIKIIDKNQLYYNYNDIDDENIRSLISDTDYEFNKSFYSSNNEKGEE